MTKLLSLTFVFLLLFTLALPSLAADSCPVSPVGLVAGTPVIITDTTSGKTDDFTSFCGDTGGGAPDAVFAFTLPAAGTLIVQVAADTSVEDPSGVLNPAVYLRTDCSEDLSCFDFDEQAELVAGDFPAGTYFFIVDGSAGSSGAFQLTALFSLPVCGDGVVNAGEACDVGAAAVDDGCGDPGDPNECQTEAAGSDDTCPGAVVAVTAGTTIVHGSTLGYGDDLRSPRAAEGGGPDRVYQIVPAITGTLSIALGLGPDGSTDVCAANVASPSCWDRALYARSSCEGELFADELGFSDQGALDVEEISFPVTAEVPVFVVVDGYDGQFYSHGTFDLRVHLE